MVTYQSYDETRVTIILYTYFSLVYKIPLSNIRDNFKPFLLIEKYDENIHGSR